MLVIRTRRLTLEPQLATHAEGMFFVLSDPAIYEYENAPPASVEWLRQRFTKLESRRSLDGTEQWLNWVIRLPSNELIGYVQATVVANETTASATIAYELSSPHWGNGFASEAVRAMVEELAAHYLVTELSAVLKQQNLRSLRLLERLGFARATSAQHEQAGVEAGELLMLRAA